MAEEKKDIDDILDLARSRFIEAVDGWSDNRRKMVDDLLFLEAGGNQWPEALRKEREVDNRPCIEVNKLPAFVAQVVGDQLQNRPGIKVRPVDNQADKDTADVLTGIIRNIENISDAQVAYDTGFKAKTQCGFGAWRIITDYVDDESFDQEIRIKRIKNQFSVWPDPLAQDWDYADGRYFFVESDLPKKEFEEEYPEASLPDWENLEGNIKDWIKPDTVRVAEYFYKEYTNGTLYEISYAEYDEYGNLMGDRIFTVEELPPEDVPYQLLRKRKVKKETIHWLKTNGHEALEGPVELPGKYFPVIVDWGEELIIEDKTVYKGIIRDAKDPQRLYNYHRSLSAETISLAPKAPYLLTPTQIEGHQSAWKQAHKKNYPYLLYNPDPQAKGIPQRQFPIQLQTGIQNEVMVADQEIHDTTGLQLASLGKRSNEQSGKAILARQREGDVGTYGYIASHGRALKYTGKVLVDLIPKIYDTPRVVRILGPDDEENYVTINQLFTDDSGEQKIHDLATGKYDVVVTIGPSYTTQRQEAAESMIEFIKAVPEAGPVMMDLLAKNLDWPGGEQIQDRLKKLLPPGIVEPEEGEEEVAESEPPPDPTMEIKLEIERTKLAQEQAQLAGIKLENEKKDIELQLKREEFAAKAMGMQ